MQTVCQNFALLRLEMISPCQLLLLLLVFVFLLEYCFFYDIYYNINTNTKGVQKQDKGRSQKIKMEI